MPKYDLFLSYNSLDHAEISQILAKLRKLPDSLNTFIDRETLTLGKHWFNEIQNALLNSRAIAVFYGKNGLGRWQNLEMMLAMDLQATTRPDYSRTLVIPVLLAGADLEKAPRFLLLNTFLDLRSPDTQSHNLIRLAQTVLMRNPSQQIALDFLQPRDALRNPYRGLDYFREEDAPLFFGRDEVAQKLLHKIKTNSLVALVGNSGSGKSSVVHAGLLPLLRRQHAPDPMWEIIVCIPAQGNVNPFHNLARAFLKSWNYAPDEIVNKRKDTEKTLRDTLSLSDCVAQTLEISKADKLLLVIDQFEELITYEKPNGDKHSSDFEPFAKLLLNAANSLECTVLLTIRGDYYGTVTERHAQLAGLIEKGTVTLNRLNDAQLREIIEKPAILSGGKLQSGLATRIIEDVAKQPGNLALLEFALTLLWNYQEDGWLMHEAYENKVGGLEGAIRNKADEVLDSLIISNRQLALAALTRLVRVSSSEEDGGDTRQRIKWKEFRPEERSCLEPFVKARLLVASGAWREPDEQQQPLTVQSYQNHAPTLEVAHEALIRQWPTLQEALKDKRKLLLWRQSIRQQYEHWQKLYNHHRDSKPEALEDLLLQGYPLMQGVKWLGERPYDLTDDETKFIRISRQHEQQEQEKEQRLADRLGILRNAGIAAFTLIVATVSMQLWINTNHASWDVALRAIGVRITYWKTGQAPEWIPKMQEIPAGTFRMGSSNQDIQDKKADSDEIPRQEVTIAKPFRIGTYEVKFSEYILFVRDVKAGKYICDIKAKPNIEPSGMGHDDRPAINLTWRDASCYAAWLSFLSGTTFRLPTEAEWEYAVRAGSTDNYYWEGKGEAQEFAWFSANAENKTQFVGKKKPNTFGLYDMAGNVWEWVQDCYKENYNQALKDGRSFEKRNCEQRVLRGGSWKDDVTILRSANRTWGGPDHYGTDIGIRLIQD